MRKLEVKSWWMVSWRKILREAEAHIGLQRWWWWYKFKFFHFPPVALQFKLLSLWNNAFFQLGLAPFLRSFHHFNVRMSDAVPSLPIFRLFGIWWRIYFLTSVCVTVGDHPALWTLVRLLLEYLYLIGNFPLVRTVSSHCTVILPYISIISHPLGI
jgi:hypothetical protein